MQSGQASSLQFLPASSQVSAAFSVSTSRRLIAEVVILVPSTRPSQAKKPLVEACALSAVVQEVTPELMPDSALNSVYLQFAQVEKTIAALAVVHGITIPERAFPVLNENIERHERVAQKIEAMMAADMACLTKVGKQCSAAPPALGHPLQKGTTRNSNDDESGQPKLEGKVKVKAKAKATTNPKKTKDKKAGKDMDVNN